MSTALVWAVVLLGGAGLVVAQTPRGSSALGDAAAAAARAKQFLAGREGAGTSAATAGNGTARALLQGRLSHAAMLRGRLWQAHTSTADLTAAWQALGPVAVNTAAYGPISGRITAVALDPNDATGNTLWLGTTGGGVWKSSNAAGPLAGVSFAPLTDTLPVFSASEGATTVPSLSIGAIAVQPVSSAVVLAGTGDPNEALDSYYGEGILRSADGGQTWTLAIGSHDGAGGNHSFAGLATAALAWSTTAPSLAVAAMTGSTEGTAVGAASAFSAAGLYYTSDAGVTWQMATVMDGAKLVQEPNPPGVAQASNDATAVVWDAPRGMFIAALRAHGYYSSVDGQTWTRLANQPGTGLTTANCPVGANGAGSANCPIGRGALAVQPATGDLYALTVDAGNNDQGLWQDLCNANAGGTCATAAPVFANRIDQGALEVGQGAGGGSTVVPQANYDLALTAAPAAGNGTVLLAGTVDLYRCTLGFGSSTCSLRNTTNAGDGCNAPAMVAPAQHGLAAMAQSTGEPLVFVGNDGGLWRSLDGVAETGPACSASDAGHFDNLNPGVSKGGSLAEVVGFAEDPFSQDTLLAGLGGSGSAATTAATGLGSWAQMSAGEGGYPQLDPATPANWYVAVGSGVDLAFCDLGGACDARYFLSAPAISEAQVSEDAALLDAATLLDPQATGSLITATCRVWRGPAGSPGSWSTANAISAAMDGSATPCSANSAQIRSVGAGGAAASATAAAQNQGSQVLYAGMAGVFDGGGALGGHVFVTQAGDVAGAATRWTDMGLSAVTNGSTGFNSDGYDVSSVVVDLHDVTGATVYATVMGFGASDIPHVYRSTDFGAHWTDATANLPNAPANSLVIDPNDANTVYLAMDTGVYVTQTITACGTTNCWSPLGTGLPNAPVTELRAAPNLPTGDGRQGMLRASTYGRGIWQTPLLTAMPIQAPQLTVAPGALSFPSTAVATASAGQTVTVTSNGNAPATISSVAIAGDFVESDNCSGQTLAVGASCTVTVQFTPTATGARAGLLTVYGNVPGGQATVSLSGNATTAAAIVLTPVSLQFAATIVNQTTAAQIITISNTGGHAATLGSPVVTGDFAITSNTCGASLPAQTGCSVAIDFTPTGSGSRSGTLALTDSAGTQTAQLNGTGQAPATDTLSPGWLSFPQQAIGSTSPVQQVTLTNLGDVALTLITASVAGTDFAATNACGSSLAPHSTCAIAVTFVPTAVGTRTATLSVTDEVRTQTISLTGVGIAGPGVTLSPANVSFAATGVGLNSPVEAVTLTNNGSLPLAVTSSVVTGDFVLASSSCGAAVQPGSACTLVLFFSPTAAGVESGTLTLSDNAARGTQTVTLTGTGMDFSLAANGATTATVSAGGTATFPLVLNSVAGLSGNVALSCTGAPANSVCTVSPATPPLGGTVLVSAVIQTATNTGKARPWGLWPVGGEVVFAGLPMAWFAARRRRRWAAMGRGTLLPVLLAFVLAGTTVVLGGCGAARVIPLPGNGSSGGGGGGLLAAPGSYAITVTGATAGVTHTVGLTLIVQ